MLPHLAFEGATKRNKPNLKVGPVFGFLAGVISIIMTNSIYGWSAC